METGLAFEELSDRVGLADWVFVGDAGEGVKEWRNGVRLAFYRGKRER